MQRPPNVTGYIHRRTNEASGQHGLPEPTVDPHCSQLLRWHAGTRSLCTGSPGGRMCARRGQCSSNAQAISDTGATPDGEGGIGQQSTAEHSSAQRTARVTTWEAKARVSSPPSVVSRRILVIRRAAGEGPMHACSDGLGALFVPRHRDCSSALGPWTCLGWASGHALCVLSCVSRTRPNAPDGRARRAGAGACPACPCAMLAVAEPTLGRRRADVGPMSGLLLRRQAADGTGAGQVTGLQCLGWQYAQVRRCAADTSDA